MFFIGVKLYEAIKSFLFIISLLFCASCIMDSPGYSLAKFLIFCFLISSIIPDLIDADQRSILDVHIKKLNMTLLGDFIYTYICISRILNKCIMYL